MTQDWRALWREECRGEFPAYRILVPESVPDSVQRVWTARGYLKPGQQPLFVSGMRRNFIKSKALFVTSAGTGAAATGVMGLSTLGISALIDSVFVAGAVVTGAVAAAAAGASGWTGWKYLRDPKRLGRRQRELAAGARWITPADLGFLAGRERRDTDEQRLMQLAVAISHNIRSTRAWSHPMLTDHVSRVDLDHALASIGDRLVELYRLRAELDRISEPHLERSIAAYRSKLSQAFKSLAARVVAMHDYLLHLRELSVQLLKLEHTEQSRALGDRVLDVLARTSADDSADWQFRELNLEAESHSEVIKGLLGELEESAEEFDGLDDLDRRLAQVQKEQSTLPTD